MKFVDALARAITGEVPRRIVVAGRGSLSVFPTQGAYVSDFHDLSGFEDFGAQLADCSWAAPPPDALPVGELRWRLSFQSALREADAMSMPPGMMHLRRWPELSEVPAELLTQVVRLCALLWRKPTATAVVHAILAEDNQRTAALARVLLSFGYVEIIGIQGTTLPTDHRTDALWAPQERLRQDALAHASGAANASESTAGGGLIGKLWRRLVGG